VAATGLILKKVGQVCYCANFDSSFPTLKPLKSLISLIFGSCIRMVMDHALSQSASDSVIKLAPDEKSYNEAFFFWFWLLKICLSSSFKPLAFKHRFIAVVLSVASSGQPHWLAVIV